MKAQAELARISRAHILRSASCSLPHKIGSEAAPFLTLHRPFLVTLFKVRADV